MRLTLDPHDAHGPQHVQYHQQDRWQQEKQVFVCRGIYAAAVAHFAFYPADGIDEAFHIILAFTDLKILAIGEVGQFAKGRVIEFGDHFFVLVVAFEARAVRDLAALSRAHPEREHPYASLADVGGNGRGLLTKVFAIADQDEDFRTGFQGLAIAFFFCFEFV